MPPRPPPTPGVLTALCSIATAATVWAAMAGEQMVRGIAGRMLGVPFHGLKLTSRYLPAADQGSLTVMGHFGYLLMTVAGAILLIGVAWLLYLVVRALNSSGVFRGLVLALIVVTAIWIPAALIAAALPGGAGPIAELYARLGPPMAGRWTALPLGLLALWLACGVVSVTAVTIGRSWMRADSTDFRRKLVRVVAGWPAVTCLVVLCYGAGWATLAGAGGIAATAMLLLHFQTR